MAFYNRTAEIQKLRRAWDREGAQFVVVYGRRRCGKSTLLQEVLEKEDVYHLAVQADPNLQRKLFSQTLARRFPAFDAVPYPDWDGLFKTLIARGGPQYTLVLDEFPYLVKEDRSLPSILQRLVDDRSDLPFNLVVCGSSQQMMEDAVLSANAPLYGRADEILKITPLAAGHLCEYLPNLSAEDLIREYGVWGGVPRYWELRSRHPDLKTAVIELLLRPTSLLRDEPRRLLLDDVRSLVQPLSLLTLISGGVHRISELGGRLGKPAAELARPLKRLISLGYVAKEIPFGAPARGSKQTLYKVADPFMRFYHRFVIPDVSRIERDRGDEVWREIESSLDLFISQEWEHLVREAIMAGAAGMQFSNCERWWGKTKTGRPVEIDCVARSRDGKQLLLGECKWSRKTINAEKEHGRLNDLAKTLPFYKGEEVLTLTASPSVTQTDGNLHLSPQAILTALRK